MTEESHRIILPSNRDLAKYRYFIRYPWASPYETARRRVKLHNKKSRRKIEFSLSVDWAKYSYTGFCSVTGLAFQPRRGLGMQTLRHPSIDRIKPELGYIPENCRWVTLSYNSLKSDKTDEEAFEIAKAVYLTNRDKYETGYGFM